MKLVSSLALATALVVGGIAAAPAAAQKKAEQAAPASERKFNLSKEARQAISDLQKALNEKSADFPQKLAAAEAVAKNSDDKYVIAKFKLQRAIEDGDTARQNAAVQEILASGGADAAESKTLRDYLAEQAIKSGDFGQAETFYAERVAANPNDLDSVVNLARAKIELKKDREGLDLLRRAIELSEATGKPAPESWYTNALGLAHRQKMRAETAEIAQQVLKHYPNSTNLRNAISMVSTRELDREAYLDLLRLMYLAGAMDAGEQYLELASVLDERAFPGEAKAVLEAAQRKGVATGSPGSQLLSRVSGRVAEDRGALPGVEAKARGAANGTLALSTATAYAGYGDWAKAIEFYKIALEKGGVDANAVNTRLGIAYAMSGRKAEAEAAFRALTGARADMTPLWLAWLAQRG